MLNTCNQKNLLPNGVNFLVHQGSSEKPLNLLNPNRRYSGIASAGSETIKAGITAFTWLCLQMPFLSNSGNQSNLFLHRALDQKFHFHFNHFQISLPTSFIIITIFIGISQKNWYDSFVDISWLWCKWRIIWY